MGGFLGLQKEASVQEAPPQSEPLTVSSSSPSPRFAYCGEGEQVLVDVCYGVVRVTSYEEQGKPVTYAAHWEHGGKDFPTQPGSTLTIVGVGEFEIIGVKAELSYTRHDIEDIPDAHGVFFQTCLENDRERMIFIEAKEND